MKKTCFLPVLLGALLSQPLMVSAADAKKETKTEKTAAKSYPLKTCIVSDEKLGEMGDPYVFTEGNQEIKLCCKSCKKDFDKDKAKFLKKIASNHKK